MNLSHYKVKNDRLTIIIIVGCLLRIVYFIWGADIYLGEKKYIMGDTAGWTESFINLLENGTYTFDITNPDAAFGRVPGFSFFWGIHYLIFGNYVYQAVAISQLILDTIAIYIIYQITINIYNHNNTAIIASILYATYPFIIGWITVSYSELLTNFSILIIIYLITKKDKSKKHFVYIGCLCAIAFFIREFAGILFPIAVITFFVSDKISIKTKTQCSTLVILSFITVYSAWPIRNFINHNRLVLARTMGGFERYNEDFLAFRTWVNTWDPDESKWLAQLASSDSQIKYPNQAFVNDIEREKANKLTALSRSCGTSFQYWRSDYNLPVNSKYNCNEEIARGFNELTMSLIKNKTWFYFTNVPLKNLHKAIFKNELFSGSVIQSNTQKIMSLLFGYRTILIILGFTGVVLSWKYKGIIPIAGYCIFMYLFLSFVIRFLEMRNLLQADTLLLIPAAYSISQAFVFINTDWRQMLLNK
ncbi:glycosyltransferase family 39 protein [Rufibacter psychrotolerans]|uniref:glycosyltransferase family 39 protein n=1 Tax=Rufibacter psychrotolerans TaxID=2812556 RepID=UPI0019677E58|nr:glycosyltransferase family 39 protein [Rufibacter sp. SYSU D00308]